MRSTTGLLRGAGRLCALLAVLGAVLAVPSRVLAQPPVEPAGVDAGQQAERAPGGEASLVLPNLPVHRSMREVSELIYETCKTYLVTQGKFLALLEIFIAVIIVLYFGLLSGLGAMRVLIILLFSVIGILGSYSVAWFGIRVNTYANSRTAFASLEGRPYPVYAIPLRSGMSVGMMLISVELLIMLFILLFIPGDYAGPCFIGFAIGESLGAAALRIAGGIFTKIADIGSDLMKIVFNIKEDDARNPGVIADCTGDNAGDSVGPSADGFETYGVTGVALRHARHDDHRQRRLLSDQRGDRERPLRDRDTHELRGAVDVAGVADVDRFGGFHVRRVAHAHPGSRRRHAVVEARHHHHVRHARRGDHPGTGQSVYLGRLVPRARGRHLVA
jgi:hypothetical protein